MTRATVVVVMREGLRSEYARRLRLARAEVDVEAAALAHRHVADRNQRTQYEYRQHESGEQPLAPPRAEPTRNSLPHAE